MHINIVFQNNLEFIININNSEIFKTWVTSLSTIGIRSIIGWMSEESTCNICQKFEFPSRNFHLIYYSHQIKGRQSCIWMCKIKCLQLSHSTSVKLYLVLNISTLNFQRWLNCLHPTDLFAREMGVVSTGIIIKITFPSRHQTGRLINQTLIYILKFILIRK